MAPPDSSKNINFSFEYAVSIIVVLLVCYILMKNFNGKFR